MSGCGIEYFREGRINKPIKITPEVIEWATNPTILEEMRNFSLIKRADLIRQKFGFNKLGKTSVLQMYKCAKVSYKIPRYVYFAKMRKSLKIKSEQVEFTNNIGRLRMNGNLVIFIDETTFHLW